MRREQNVLISRLASIVCAFALTVTALPGSAPVAQAHPAPGGASDKIMFGFPIESLSDAEASFAGQPAMKQRWVNVWAGFWIKRDGWGHIESSLKQASATGHPLIIHWYYWGDGISLNNVRCNCSSGDSSGNKRTVADWEAMARQLESRIRTHGGGKEIIVTIEMEFNKNGIPEDEKFAAYFDTLLAKHSNIFRSIPNVKTVIGFGNWGYHRWGLFDDAVRNSDYLGTQFLNSTYINLNRYKFAVNDTLTGVKELRRQFGPTTPFGKQKVVIYDWGLSAWRDTDAAPYTQEWNIKYLESRLGDFRANGVFLFNFRAVKHGGVCRPYHGCAEGWFGFRTSAAANASYDDVVRLVNNEYDRSLPNQPPVARFTHSCTTSRACSFDASGSTDDGSIASYSWSWGDGSAAGSGVTPSHTYAADGTYNVVLTVTDNLGAKDTETRAVTVQGAAANQPPVANVTWICDGLACSFDGTASYDPDGTVTSWSWTFGDGGTGSGSRATHTYAAAGTYNVQVTVQDNSGATNSKTAAVTVRASTFTAPAIPTRVEGELFRYKSTGGNHSDAAYSGGRAWNLWANGSMEHAIRAPTAATYEFAIRAKGDLAGSEAPHMTLRINEVLVAEWDVTGTLAEYVFVTKLPAGTHSFRVNFTNDYVGGPGADRNLKVDYLEARTSDPMLPGVFEAESFSVRNTGGSYPSSGTDPAFSGGKGWMLDTNNGIEQRVRTFGTANYSFTIRAKEDQALPGHAHMRLLLDGVVKYETDVVGTTLASYTTQFAIGPGDHTLRLEFTNDACCGSGDRNLKIDVMWVNATRPSLPGSFEAEAFTRRPVGLGYSDASFSGGQGWNIHSNGAIAQDVYHPQPTTYRVTIAAKEDFVAPTHAHMRLKVDGVVRFETDVVTTTVATYATTLLIAAGDHTVEVEFTNDACCDRNLRVDVVRFFNV